MRNNEMKIKKNIGGSRFVLTAYEFLGSAWLLFESAARVGPW
jgi:hypothetical protein